MPSKVQAEYEKSPKVKVEKEYRPFRDVLESPGIPPRGRPFHPHETLRDLILIMFLTGAIFLVAGVSPPPLHEPADPNGQPEVILPDWYLLWAYGALKAAPEMEVFGFAFTALTIGTLAQVILMGLISNIPFIDRGHEKRPLESPWAAAMGIGGIMLIFMMSIYSVDLVVHAYYFADIMEFDQFRVVLTLLSMAVPIVSTIITWAAIRTITPNLTMETKEDMEDVYKFGVQTKEQQRIYEYRLNKCYGCKKCEDFCPLTTLGIIKDLNLVNNIYLGITEDTWTCLTCGRCTAVCPQEMDYTAFILTKRQQLASQRPKVADKGMLTEIAEMEADMVDEEWPFVPLARKSEWAYYGGCLRHFDNVMNLPYNFMATQDSALRLLKECGIDAQVLEIKCTGHDQYMQALTETYERLKDYNIRRIKDSGVKKIVATCAECVYAFKIMYDLPNVLPGLEIYHLSEVLDMHKDKLSLSLPKETKVTFHDPCRLGRQMGVYDAPRTLIESTKGAELVEMASNRENSLCCGVPGFTMCLENKPIRQERFRQAKEAGAEVMACGCPKCIMHYLCVGGGDELLKDVQVVDLAYFLAQGLNNKDPRVVPASAPAPAAAARPGPKPLAADGGVDVEVRGG
jgi:Fe-S oxidoreductase